MLTLAFGKGETDFQAVGLVFFIYVFDKGLEVLSRFVGLSGFFGFVRHVYILFMRNEGFSYDYNTRSDLSATGDKIKTGRLQN